jgi:hypothetical protein
MNNKRIRKLSEMIAVSSDSLDTKWITFSYEVGTDRKLPIFGKDLPVKRTITEIIENEKHFVVYIANEEASQEWIKIPITDRIKIEYFIQ